MIFRFDAHELDLARVELRSHGAVVPVEPQVFAVLALLVANRERMVSRDELIEKVWDGRVVSDAAVASRIKSARQALGDDGAAQRYIRTVHGQGYRFVGAAQSAAVPVEEPPAIGSRPSIAVLPFAELGDAAGASTIGLAIAHELIADLSRLRWLWVTARGSSFRFAADETRYAEVGRMLGVRYVLRGTVEAVARRLGLAVQLVDARDEQVVWADRLQGSRDDVHLLRETLRDRVLAALEVRIPLHEAGLARGAAVRDLDAWSAFHLGVQHLYRFNRSDTAAAAQLFQRALVLDPAFARAHAGLSFVHFQTAFLRHALDPDAEVDAARRHAERGVELDALDPFVNFTMGRTFWLEGDLDRSLGWLDRATTLSPHYAQGLYARAWAEALSGRAEAGRRDVDLAMRLSPLDPLHYAMLGTRAFTHMDAGEDAEAAAWAERAARAPGAHVLIAMIAAAAHSLAGDLPRATRWADEVRARDPRLGRADFFVSFPMKPEAMRARVSQALARLGF
jgi:TolB-like protein/Tfp pilus assembly protein PilF